MTYRLFHDGAEIDESTASAMLIDASLWRGFDIRELRAVFKTACDFSDHESLDSMMARESIFSQVEIEIVPADSDSLICTANPCAFHDIGDGECSGAYVPTPLDKTSDGDPWRNAPQSDYTATYGLDWRNAPATPVSDIERFAAMSFQSVANLVLRESASDLDRLKAWEYLNASADDMATYWGGLSLMARSRILGAMALDLSALGFVTAES